MATSANAVNSGANVYHTNQNNSPQQQQLSVHNPIKKQHKAHQMQQQQPQQQFSKSESTTTGATNTGCDSVSESSTQTINVGEEIIASNNIVDVSYQDGGTYIRLVHFQNRKSNFAINILDLCIQDENDECDNSVNGCLSITTTTSTKNYDRIEVQKFKNQATSPNIPINEKDDIVKREVYNKKNPSHKLLNMFILVYLAFKSDPDKCDPNSTITNSTAISDAESRNPALFAFYSI